MLPKRAHTQPKVLNIHPMMRIGVPFLLVNLGVIGGQ
ncbi:hypothetical protein SAMN04490194_6046 [Pseudomonas migulae]|uniref:Uncharacterized protein n=1 Tax=Pseudomonas migulae TaxID=78543 RepID=A0A1H5NGS8_9PSED|nr:hypothetical protein SAMN04490194_6046 [Pseudomonas migulae]